MLKFKDFLFETRYYNPEKQEKFTDLVNSKFGKPTDSDVDHYRLEEIHTETNENGENLRELSAKSKSVSPEPGSGYFGANLTHDQRQYLRHIYFRHFRPAQDKLIEAKQKYRNAHKEEDKNKALSLYHNARIQRRAAMVEAKDHFSKVINPQFGGRLNNVMHYSSFIDRNKKQQYAVDEFHKMMSELSPERVEYRKTIGSVSLKNPKNPEHDPNYVPHEQPSRERIMGTLSLGRRR